MNYKLLKLFSYIIFGIYLLFLQDLIINALLGFFLLIAATVMCSSLTQLGNSINVKEAGLTFSSMEGAIVSYTALDKTK